MQLTQHISKITYKSPNATNIKRKERIEGMNINLFINQTVGRLAETAGHRPAVKLELNLSRA